MKNYFINKKVLITGHSGFKGSWLSMFLHILGCEVYGLSDFSVNSGIYNEISDKDIFKKEFNASICDKESIENIILDTKFDTVFHFAAQGLVSEAKRDPENTLITNIIGTFNVLEFCNLNKNIKTLTIATTDKVYKNHNDKNTEDFKLGGDEFYSASKAGAEHIINAFAKTRKRNDLNIGIVRSGNVLGGGDYGKDRILTDIFNSLIYNSDISLRNPSSIRPWQYVLDSIFGYLLVDKYIYENNTDEIFNLNTKLIDNYTVLDLTNYILKFWGSENNLEITNNKEVEFSESKILTIDSSKAEKLLGWKPQFDIEKICENIVNYEKNSDKFNWSISHIKSFLNNI